MASGKNHDASILFCTLIVGALTAHYFTPELGLIVGSAHLLGGWFLSPDLDLKSRPWRRWGILRVLWIPYMRMIPRHRHWMSHGIGVGSALRLLYLACWVAPLWLLPEVRGIHWAGLSVPNVLAFLAGVEVSAINHLVLDGMLIPLPAGVKNRLKGG